MSYDKEDPKDNRRTRVTEGLLRQFLKLESGLGNNSRFVENYDVAMKGSPALEVPLHCDSCDFIAKDLADIHFHERNCPGHEIL